MLKSNFKKGQWINVKYHGQKCRAKIADLFYHEKKNEWIYLLGIDSPNYHRLKYTERTESKLLTILIES